MHAPCCVLPEGPPEVRRAIVSGTGRVLGDWCGDAPAGKGGSGTSSPTAYSVSRRSQEMRTDTGIEKAATGCLRRHITWMRRSSGAWGWPRVGSRDRAGKGAEHQAGTLHRPRLNPHPQGLVSLSATWTHWQAHGAQRGVRHAEGRNRLAPPLPTPEHGPRFGEAPPTTAS